MASFIAGLKHSSSNGCSPKPVVLMGDLNCARTPKDIYTTKNKEKSAGFTPQERLSFEKRILGQAKSSSASAAASAAASASDSASAAGASAGSTVAGLRDVWRERHPERVEYTYWSYRGGNFPTNRGWRLDYSLVHPELVGGGSAAAAAAGKGNGGGSKSKGEGEKENANNDNTSLIYDVFHLPHVRGSDHCPIGIAIRAEGHGEELV